MIRAIYARNDSNKERKGGYMDLESFAAALLKSIKKTGLPIARAERIRPHKAMFRIGMSDQSEFWLQIGKQDSLRESSLEKRDQKNGKIHEIFENCASGREYNDALMREDIDLEWLLGELELKDFRKLEDYILRYSSRNEEIVFRQGFQYAWSLFCECSNLEGF